MKAYRAVALGTTLALAGCAGRGGGAAPVTGPASTTPEVGSGWRKVATAADRGRLRGWRSAWVQALAQARSAGHGADLAADTAFFDPDRMLADPLPPAGGYRCRVVKLGSRGGVGIGYVAYPVFRCRITVACGVLRFAKLTGSQRAVGSIFTSEPARAVFLGTVALGDETRSIDYGRDTTRDMAGFVERIDTKRWRMVFPYPAFESTLDVMELVPEP